MKVSDLYRPDSLGLQDFVDVLLPPEQEAVWVAVVLHFRRGFPGVDGDCAFDDPDSAVPANTCDGDRFDEGQLSDNENC